MAVKREWLIAAAVLIPVALTTGCQKKTTEPVQTDGSVGLGELAPAPAPSDPILSDPTFMGGTAQPGAYAPATGGRIHVVQRGDTLMQIARQYYNGDASKWKLIRDANNIQGDAIKVGQQLVIP